MSQAWSIDLSTWPEHYSTRDQRSRDGIDIGDGAWGRHGAGDVHGHGRGRVRSGCESTEWESETSMRCMVGHGAGGTRRGVMTVGERGGQRESGMVDRGTWPEHRDSD